MGWIQASDFLLCISECGHEYCIRVRSPLTGPEKQQMVRRTDLINLDVSTTGLSHGCIPTATESQRIGYQLYKTIFQDGLHDLMQRALAEVHARSTRMRILVELGQDPLLHSMPWELLHDGQRFLTLEPTVSFARYRKQGSQAEFTHINPPLRILFTTACPKNLPSDGLVTKERALWTALEPLLGQEVELAVERNVSLGRVRDALLGAHTANQPFHIWHHCGYSQQRQTAEGRYELLLERQATEQPAHLDELNRVFEQCGSLRLVILDTYHRGPVATALSVPLKLEVPAVVSFLSEMSVSLVTTFLRTLYAKLLTDDVDRALAQARVTLANQHGHSLAWVLPLLSLRTSEPVMLMPRREDPYPWPAPFGKYWVGLQRMRDQLGNAPPLLRRFHNFEIQLHENIEYVLQFGPSPEYSRDRFRILEGLDELARDALRVRFLDLCEIE